MRRKTRILAIILFFPISLYASSLSVRFYRGGNCIDFGKVDRDSVVTAEVRIKINSSKGSPYQVKQIICEPIRNEKGEILKDEVLYFYTVRGSNSRGALYNTIMHPLDFKESLLYVSDTEGSPDSFKIIYLFDGKKLTTSGHFLGRIAYVFEPRRGMPETFIFDVRFNVHSKFGMKIHIPTGRLRLSTESKEEKIKYIEISLECTKGKRVNIYQRVEKPFMDIKGDRLPQGCVKFYISESRKGGKYFIPSELEEKELLIYSSNEGPDRFKINFLLDEEKLKGVKAGLYRGRVVYRVLQEEKEKMIPLDLEIEIAKVFNMEIEGSNLFFSHLRPNAPPQEREVIIKIKSNLRRPYQVSQRFIGPLVNKKGEKIPFKYISIREEIVEGEGKILYPIAKPLTGKEELLFLSNSSGSPAVFKVIYCIKPSWEIPPGSYSSSITYSLSER